MSLHLHLPPVALQHRYEEVAYIQELKGKSVNLRLLKDVSFVPPTHQVTSISVVPITNSGKVIVTILERGPDIPGGHVEISDLSLVQAVEREAYEEACIVLARPVYLIGIITSDYKTTRSPHVTYMLIVTSGVERMDDFSAVFESFGRQEMTSEEFLGQYRAGSPAMMEELLSRARSLNKNMIRN